MVNQVKLNSRGMAKLLKNPEMQALMEHKATAISEGVYEPNHKSGPLTVYIRSKVGRSRVLAWVSVVHPLAGRLEARFRMLGSAIWRAR